MKEKNYETQIQKLLMKAVVLDHSKSPCDEDFLPTDDKADSERAYLVFIKMVHSKDYSTWLKMASCFGEYPANQLLMKLPESDKFDDDYLQITWLSNF